MRVSLVDICDFQGGTQPPKEEWIDHPEPGYIRMLQIRDFTQPDKDQIEYIMQTKRIKTCTADDILIGRYGASVGKILTGLSGAYNVAIIKTIPNNQKILNKYLFHYLHSPYFQNYILSVGSRAAQAGFNKEDLKNALITLPSLDEQNDIVIKLELLTQLIFLRKQQLAKLDELVKARFVEMFGECNYFESLETFAELITKGASPKWQGVDYTDSGTLFITSENIRAGYVDLDKRKYLDNRINAIQPRSVLHKKDVLINIVGASIGRAAVFEYDELANINQAVALVRVDTKRINMNFLVTYLNSTQAMKQYAEMKKGGARDNLSLRNIADLHIPVAPIELQEQFASFAEQVAKSKLTIQESLDKLEVLKKSLMQEFFG